MVGLLDIAPDNSEVIDVKGTPVEVSGVPVKGLVTLFRRFPPLQAVFLGRGIDQELLLDLGADIIAAIIAAGVGRPGDEEYETRAASLPAAVQIELVLAIIGLTMPKGFRPFVERMERLGMVLKPDARSSTSTPEKNDPAIPDQEPGTKLRRVSRL